MGVRGRLTRSSVVRGAAGLGLAALSRPGFAWALGPPPPSLHDLAVFTARPLDGDHRRFATVDPHRRGRRLAVIRFRLEQPATVKVQEDPERLRPSDVQILVGDCSRFQRATGWTTTIPFEVTLKDLLDDWRERV